MSLLKDDFLSYFTSDYVCMKCNLNSSNKHPSQYRIMKNNQSSDIIKDIIN